MSVKWVPFGALLFVLGCVELPTDSALSAFLEANSQDLEELAGMLDADFTEHDVIVVSRSTVEVLFGSPVASLDSGRLGAYCLRLSRLGLERVAMTPFGSPTERHPTFEVVTRGFSGNFTQRGVLKAHRCPGSFADTSDEQQFVVLKPGWCRYTWHSP